jgi:hypothetical protein
MFSSPRLRLGRKEAAAVAEFIEWRSSGNAEWLLNPYASAIASDDYGFAFTLDVMDAITVEAILNWSLRFLIPCRRAIQSKSV